MYWLIYPVLLIIIGLIFDVWYSFFHSFEWLPMGKIVFILSITISLGMIIGHFI